MAKGTIKGAKNCNGDKKMHKTTVEMINMMNKTVKGQQLGIKKVGK